ncbi:UNVERIFIED_CONTAM: hypothetical protein Sradi_3230900 [Sesamum radiatum]|uniref:Uncharacterized protein n=1 Tax=Sesamum radiatum TaxID=300843 RepID=A0AAW2RGR8_SESRA
MTEKLEMSWRSIWCRRKLRKSIEHCIHFNHFVYMLTRTSTDRVGENVTGCSLGKMTDSDLGRTCGQLGDIGQHIGAQTTIEQIFVPIWDSNVVHMETSTMYEDVIRQVRSHSENVWARRYKGDDLALHCTRAGDKCVKQSALPLDIKRFIFFGFFIRK